MKKEENKKPLTIKEYIEALEKIMAEQGEDVEMWEMYDGDRFPAIEPDYNADNNIVFVAWS